MGQYVKSGYVESGYVEGDIDLSSSTKKKINFVVDNQNLGESDLKSLLLSSFGEEYENDVNVVFGSSLVVVEKRDGVTVMKEVAGQMKQEDIDTIDEKIDSVNERVTVVDEKIDNLSISLLQDFDFINSISKLVLENINVSLIAKNGDEIATGLIFDNTKNAYVLDYDTSLLDGTDYTIEMKLS